MTEKIRVDVACYVDINFTLELEELINKYFDTDDDEIYDEIGKKIRKCINEELYKKGFREAEILDWNCVEVSE